MDLPSSFNQTQTLSNLSGVDTTKFGTGTMGGVSSGRGIGAGGALMITGAVLNLGSQIFGLSLQSKVSKANAGLMEAQGNYSSAVAEFNAAVARANAEAIRNVADFDIARQQKAAKRLKSSQMAGYSKAGVKLEGSPLEVMIDSAQQARLDIAITDYNAKVGMLRASSQASGYDKTAEVAKSNATASSNLLKASSKYQSQQGVIKGATSLLSTVASYSR